MAINSYTSLTQALPALLDCATADISGISDNLIWFAEQRIMREVRVPEMEQDLSVNISAGVAALPSDYIELKYAYIDGTPTQYIQMVPPAYIYDVYPTRAADGKPIVCARDGSNLVFGPYPDDAYVLKGRYFRHLSSIGASTASNAIMDSHGELYTYATMALGYKHLGRDEPAAVYEQRYAFVKNLVEGEAERSRFSGNLQIRAAL